MNKKYFSKEALILSTEELREIFKNLLSSLTTKIVSAKTQDELYELNIEIHKTSEAIEKLIQEKVQLLSNNFANLPLSDHYQQTVREGFSDIDQLLSHSKTLVDCLHFSPRSTLKDSLEGSPIQIDKTEIIPKIKQHYAKTLVLLLNIMAKVENDYLSFMIQIQNTDPMFIAPHKKHR